MAEAGRPTDLTDELVKKIRQCILDGNNLKETANICEIDEQKLYNWKYDNYLNISDKIEGWRRDRKVMLASKNIDDILEIDITNRGVTKDGKEIYEYDDTGKLRIKADISKFVLEVLDKNYKPKQDITSDNKPLPLLGGLSNVSDNNSNEEVAKTE